ncbi:MAG: STAS domain-containing protein [Patescibacteria group bacterium]|nr:STAS domain-containing protein [Patescibacteria group bacterium]
MAEATITFEDVQVDGDKQVKLIKVAGQLDESNVDDEAKKIYKLIEDVGGNLSLIFDFSELEYMNSKSIGYLTDWYSKVSASGGKVAIAQAKSNIVDILQVVGLTQLINTFPSIEEAKVAVV